MAASTISISFEIQTGKNGMKELILDADGLRKVMEQNVRVSQEMQEKIFNTAASVTVLKGISDAAGQLNSVFNSLTGESVNFDNAMKAANTMAGKDSAGFDHLKGQVADLAKEIPIARDQLANGLYQVISNGVPEDNWMNYLNASARSAVGGLADINKVVGVTATMIKNYGLEWEAAADIQDKIQLTAKNGVTSFEQLSQALPRVTGNAATLGVTVDELLGTFATLTGVSGNTAEVSTQLAAIFTALVKPSSEAADMAEKMGIQFDAAAIKAAGGFQNFLQQLDKSVKAYSAANGMLEQEVYSKLFGSAESLRALIPLQGELADKFTSNVAAMVNSAGTMDAAYNDMAGTGNAVTQMLKNQWASLIDVVAGLISSYQPYLEFSANLIETTTSVSTFIVALKQLNTMSALTAARTKALSVLMAALGLKGKSVAAVVRILSGALKTGAYRMTAFKIAARGALLVSGVGVAIAAVTAIVEHFSNAAEKAADNTEKLDDATEEYTQAAASAKVQIDQDIKALNDLIKSKKSAAEAVDELNEKYGDLFGAHKTAEEWYNILTEKSRQYIKQIGYEAQARALAAKIAEASINKELAAEKKADLERRGLDKRKVHSLVTGSAHTAETKEYKKAKKELEEAVSTEEELQKRLDVISGKAKEIASETSINQTDSNKQVAISSMTWQQVADAMEKTEKSLKNTTDPKKIKELKSYNGTTVRDSLLI